MCVSSQSSSALTCPSATRRLCAPGIAPEHGGPHLVLRAVPLGPGEERAEQRHGRRPRGFVEPLVLAHLSERSLRRRLGGDEPELVGVERMEAGEQGADLQPERPPLSRL